MPASAVRLISRRAGAQRLLMAPLLLVVLLPACTSAQPRVLSLPSPDAGVNIVSPDGGTDPWSRFAHPLLGGRPGFPIGVWFESVTDAHDATADAAAGINTYVALTANSDLRLLAREGATALVSRGRAEAGGRQPGGQDDAAGAAGWLLGDELDMTPGPGAGNRRMQALHDALPADRRLRYANYGKGVLFWESDAQAASFVNGYQDAVSADAYWFTDPNICGGGEGGVLLGGGRALSTAACRNAANYGASIRRLRALVSPAASRPVLGFVEVGHPASESAAPSITPSQITAAVWSSVLAGARGIIYFNHSFGGPCQTQHALREPCYRTERAAVTAVDARLASLAPVLNADTVTGLADGGQALDVMVKDQGGAYWVFAQSKAPGDGSRTATVALSCPEAGLAQVVGEDREVPLTPSGITDRFEGNGAFHLYRIRVGGCGPA